MQVGSVKPSLLQQAFKSGMSHMGTTFTMLGTLGTLLTVFAPNPLARTPKTDLITTATTEAAKVAPAATTFLQKLAKLPKGVFNFLLPKHIYTPKAFAQKIILQDGNQKIRAWYKTYQSLAGKIPYVGNFFKTLVTAKGIRFKPILALAGILGMSAPFVKAATKPIFTKLFGKAAPQVAQAAKTGFKLTPKTAAIGITGAVAAGVVLNKNG